MRTRLSTWLQNIFGMESSSVPSPIITAERFSELKELQGKLAYNFRNIALLENALIHRSFVHENQFLGYKDNERLEFLGDAVLQLCISALLMKKFPNHTEGPLSKLRASVVNEKPLAELAKKYQIGNYLRFGKGEENSGGRKKQSLLANTMEALIAAIYLDGGFEEIYIFVEKLFEPLLVEGTQPAGYTDYKTTLQEYSQSRFKETPKYKLIATSGPDHDKTFETELTLTALLTTTRGIGKNKKMAEQQAAQKALEELISLEDIHNSQPE